MGFGGIGKAVGAAIALPSTAISKAAAPVVGQSAANKIGLMANPTSFLSGALTEKLISGTLSDKEKDALAKAGIDPMTGMPAQYEYTSFLQDGKLPEELKYKSYYDPRAVEALRAQALEAPGKSAWEALALKNQRVEQQMGMDQASRMAAQGTAQARAQLASRGGLRGGAAERLAAGGGLNAMMARQQVAGAGRTARAGIGLSAEQMRQQGLMAMPGVEAAHAQAMGATEQANINRVIEELRAKEQAKLMSYQERMRAWAGGKQAEATLASAPKPGLFGQITGGLF